MVNARALLLAADSPPVFTASRMEMALAKNASAWRLST